MIETRDGLDNLDSILDVPGIDGVFVGPNDLSLALGLQPASDQEAKVFTDAIDRIVDGCRARGLVAGLRRAPPRSRPSGWRRASASSR